MRKNKIPFDVEKLQDSVEKGLRSSCGNLCYESDSHLSNVLKNIAEKPRNIVKKSLGNFGVRLQKFAATVDPLHPAISSMDKELVILIQELLIYVDMASANNLSKAMGFISGAVDNQMLRRKNLNEPMRLISKPSARTLINKSEREDARSGKDFKTIDYDPSSWDSSLNDFLLFTRLNNFYEDYAGIARKKMEDFYSRNLPFLAETAIENLKQVRMEPSYYGFYRIKIQEAAVILGKVHGFSINPRYGVASALMSDYDGFLFWNTSELLYRPTAYPIHLFTAARPPRVNKILDILESFPDLRGKPAFDHYWVVVPGVVRVQVGADNECHFRSRMGEEKIFANSVLLHKALDIDLTNEGYCTPVILGEVDGKCYFVSYWA